jgi:RHS repeat-associated protein
MARGSVTHPSSRPAKLLALATAVCAVLLGAGVAPAHAAEPTGDGTPTVAGDFAIGDGLEGLVDEQDGSFGATMAIGDVALRWDSRAAAAGDRFGLGAGWAYQLGFVDTEGGTRLVPPASGEVFEADASAPSGLRGYTLEDLKFRRLDAGAVRAVPGAAFALHELGGTSTWFSEAGDPIAAVSRHGEQATWEWSTTRPHQLERMVDDDGVETTLDWESEDGTLVIRPGANLPLDPAEPERAWRVRFDGRGAIESVVQPTGDRTEFAYEGARLSTISNPAGARTRIEWQRFDDGVPRVRRVSTSDPDGEELSARAWDRFGTSLPSGWPLLDGAGGSDGPADAAFRTALSDGVTSVRSEYSGDRLLRSRDVVSADAGGERVLRRQVFEYPEAGGAGEAGEAGETDAGPTSGTLRSRPIAMTSVRFDASGAERDERTSFEYDVFGRAVRAADGTTFTYNAANRPLTETGPDGTVMTTAYWADGTRRSVSGANADAPVSVEFVWDGAELIGETHRTGAQVTTAAYLLGTDRHARTIAGSNASSTSYYGTDRHGNVTDLTAADGDVTERYAYADYGSEAARGAGGTATSPKNTCTPVRVGDPGRNPFRYAGEYTDPTCRQHLAVRSYDTGTMRFTSMDTAAVMNPYAYTDANPITRVDPTGNFFSPDDANGTYFAIAMSALGLLTTAYAVLFPVSPLSPLAHLALGLGALGDLAALTTSSLRADDPGWLDDETDSALSQVDVLSGFVLVGVIAAAHNVWRRYEAWRLTRKATTRSRLLPAGPGDAGYSGGKGDGALGSQHSTHLKGSDADGFSTIHLTPDQSPNPSPDLSPKPSPRSGSFTFVIPDGRQVAPTGRRPGSRKGGPAGGNRVGPSSALDVPAVRVTVPGNLQEKYRAIAPGRGSSQSDIASIDGSDAPPPNILDPSSATTTRWPGGVVDG